MDTANLQPNISETPNQKRLENFEVFPKHIGVWEGEWIRLDADGKEIERFKGIVKKEIVDNQWVQTNTYQFADGRSVTHNFVGFVSGEGCIKIESSAVPFCNYNLIAQEVGDNLIIFRVWDKATGVLLGIEMIHLSNEKTCIRTSQGFTVDGKFKGSSLIHEQKIS